jgi:hypothetical protein
MARKSFARNTLRRATRLAAVVALAGTAGACGGGDLAGSPDDEAPAPRTGRHAEDPNAESIFGEGGLTIGNIERGIKGLGSGGDEKARLPVNKYIWQAALDTLSFLPLASTDPFTGVIATDWGSTPELPGERLKVTAYILDPGLSAASLKVAVYREVQTEGGLWVPAPVSADTARQLEDAILTRARQIRIAELEGSGSG